MTTINRIDVDPEGILLVRFRKASGGWHRTSIEPGVSVSAQMALVNAHLQILGEGAVQDFGQITARAAVEHTPARIQAFRAARGIPAQVLAAP